MTAHSPKLTTDQALSALHLDGVKRVENDTQPGDSVTPRAPKDDDLYSALEGPRSYAKAPWWPDSINTPPENTALSHFMLDMKMNLHCRLDVRLTSHEELKHAAYQLDLLAKKLMSIAFDGEADPVLRVLVARTEMRSWQRIFLIHGKRNQAKRDAIASVRRKRDIRKLDRQVFFDDSIDSKGENDATEK